MFDPRLVNSLRRFSTRAEASAYLDLIGDILLALGVTNEDKRFHFNPVGGTKYVLPLTINNRYVASKGRDVNKMGTWWLIHPSPHSVLDAEAGKWLDQWAFRRRSHDLLEGAPILVQYQADFVLEHLPVLRPMIVAVARREFLSCRGTTPSRQYYNSQAYALALDDAAREELLAGVTFGASGRRKRPV